MDYEAMRRRCIIGRRALEPGDCPDCGARPGEPCPLDGLPPELTKYPRIGGNSGAVCAADVEICESCQ